MQHQRWIRFFRTRESLKSNPMSRSLLNATSLNRIGKKAQIHKIMKLITSSPSSSSKYWYDAASETIIDGKKKIEEEKKNDKESE